jgi:hypothetical protein
MTVPIIVVVTKFDLYVAGLQRRSGTMTKISYQSAEDDFKKEFDQTFDKSMSEGQIPYALVSSMFFVKAAPSLLTSCRKTGRLLSTASQNHKGEHTYGLIEWRRPR